SEVMGHSIVIPKRRVNSFFELSNHEQNACIIMVNRVRKILIEKLKPQSFDVVINDKLKIESSIKYSCINIIPLYS
ncbi:MAG: HIT domain-containing protein, partial [Chlorobi bacterium]|nr:HIT domain-containing protein [Chlorobiota bacterium]